MKFSIKTKILLKKKDSVGNKELEYFEEKNRYMKLYYNNLKYDAYEKA